MIDNDNSRTILINPYPGGTGLNEATVLPPLGLGYIAAVIEQHGGKVQIIDANLEGLETNAVLERISPGVRLIGIYVNSFNYNAVSDLARGIHIKYPDVVVVLGGPLPSASPRDVLDNIICNGVVRGEGEFSLLKIRENLARGSQAFDREVPGAVFYDEKKQLIMNPVERIRNLDILPFPAYHLFPPLKNYKVRSRQTPTAAIITSRGCSQQCIFCSKDVFLDKVTFRSAENVLEEIDFLVEHYGVRQVDILDDNFMQKISRVQEILDGLIERDYGISVNLQSGVRTEKLDDAILNKMKKAGFYKIGFGIESADEKVLKIARKNLNLEKARQAVHSAKTHGFEVYGFFIIGLPGETEAAFQRTLNFAREVDFDIANFCMAIPFPGTELYNMVKDKGKFLVDTTKNINEGFYAGNVFYEYEGIKAEDILRRYKRAYKEFYTLKRRIRILLKIRSIHEIVWLWDSFKFVMKGLFKKK
ncbi:MAG: B12-binding domain-containing radical SAM protein [Candidatus Aminicenantes bacterium]|nr:MAG: B12-binding domain-containing radical SAM protein [Candidatus Aminicenantes bacterium]